MAARDRTDKPTRWGPRRIVAIVCSCLLILGGVVCLIVFQTVPGWLAAVALAIAGVLWLQRAV